MESGTIRSDPRFTWGAVFFAFLTPASLAAQSVGPRACEWPGYTCDAGNLFCAWDATDQVSLHWPITDTADIGDKITATFGPRRSGADGFDFHEGIDIRAREPLPIHAPWAGRVVAVVAPCIQDGGQEGCRSADHYVVLQHDLGGRTVYTQYHHLEPLDLVEDDLDDPLINMAIRFAEGEDIEVAAGEAFLYSGATGTLAHHLHLAATVGARGARDHGVSPLRMNSLSYQDLNHAEVDFVGFTTADVACLGGAEALEFVAKSRNARAEDCPSSDCGVKPHLNRVRVVAPNGESVLVDFDRRINDDSAFAGNCLPSQPGCEDGCFAATTSSGGTALVAMAPDRFDADSSEFKSILFRVEVLSHWKVEGYRNKFQMWACDSWANGEAVECFPHCTFAFSCGGGQGVSAPSAESGACGGGPVQITSPADGSSLTAGQNVTVHVTAPLDAREVELHASPGGAPATDDSFPWSFEWTPPERGHYQLRAVAVLAGGEPIASPTVNLTVSDGIPGIAITAPPDGYRLRAGEDLAVTVRGPAGPGPSVYLTLRARRYDMVEAPPGSGTWSATVPGGDFLEGPNTVTAEVSGSPRSAQVVVFGPAPPRDTRLVLQVSGAVYTRRPTTVVVKTDAAATRFDLHVTDPGGVTEVQSWTFPQPCPEFCGNGFTWEPAGPGRYRLQAYESDGRATLPLDVDVVDRDQTIGINRESFLRVIPGLPGKGIYTWSGGQRRYEYHTGISAERYVCGVVGFAATGGDILEDAYQDATIVRSQLRAYDGEWGLSVDFKTGKKALAGEALACYGPEETWDVTLLCIDREVAALGGRDPSKPFFLQQYTGLGHDVYHATDIPVSDYACGAVGFHSGSGDINEDDERDLVQVYVYEAGPTWAIRSNFSTHHGSSQNWKVDLLCASRKVASLGGPAMPLKTVFVKDVLVSGRPALGDNVDVDTEVRTDEYACGVVGFAARSGDLDENAAYSEGCDLEPGSRARPLVWAYLHDVSGSWHFRGDFRTHEGRHESWEAKILCVARGESIIPVNLPPQIVPIPRHYVSLPARTDVSFEVSAQDANEDDIRLHVPSLPEGATFPPREGPARVTGTFHWNVPPAGDTEYRDLTVTFAAEDHELSSSRDAVVRVCGPYITDCINLRFRPRINPVPAQSVMAGQPLSFPVSATEKDGDPILLRVVCQSVEVRPGTRRCLDGPVGAEFTVEPQMDEYVQGTFTWTPSAPGAVSVTFNAHDGVDGQDFRTVDILVTPDPASRPDLTVSALGWPTTASPGATVNFVYMLRNQGTAAAVAGNGGFLTRLLVDGQPVPDGGGQVGSRRTPSLAAGTGSTNGFQWLAACGTHQVVAETDAQGQVQESREDNNLTTTHSLVVSCPPPARPDLVVESLCREERICAGSTAFASARIRNRGTAAAAASRVGLRFYQGVECLVDQAPLGPDEGQDLACTLAVPAAGAGFVSARADALAQVVESDESNNELSEGVLVEPCNPAALPDLVVASVLFSPPSPRGGQPVTVLARVENRGTAPAAGPTHVLFDEVDVGGRRLRRLCQMWVPGDIAVGPGPLVSCSVAAGFSAGTRYVQVTLDGEGFVTESTECNNAAIRPVAVGIPLTDE